MWTSRTRNKHLRCGSPALRAEKLRRRSARDQRKAGWAIIVVHPELRPSDHPDVLEKIDGNQDGDRLDDENLAESDTQMAQGTKVRKEDEEAR
jgi:hypothetical protein